MIKGDGSRHAILVLGMHRSGTSAIGGVLDALGVAGPKTSLPTNIFNPRGYWESGPLTDLHDQLLTSADSCWHDWRSLDPKWFASETAATYRQKIKNVLADEFDHEPLLFIKDPRICRFVHFMTSILAEMNIRPVAVLPLRNPLEVAHSLKRRDGIAVSKSLLMWLRHVLEAEYHSRSMPRCFLQYELLLGDWRSLMQRVARECGVTWPDQSGRPAVMIKQFLSADLRHERFTSEAIRNDPEVAPLVCATYHALVAIAAGSDTPELLERLDLLRTKFDETCHLFGNAAKVDELEIAQLRNELNEHSTEVKSLSQEHSRLVTSSEKLAQEIRRLHEELRKLQMAYDRILDERERIMRTCNELSAQRDAMMASWSWRMTAPMRSLQNMLLQHKNR